MGRLVYAMIASVDGYVADASGDFSWGTPGEQSHAFINRMSRSITTHLMGRRMYEVQMAWETMEKDPDQPEAIIEFARQWKGSDKIVYSTTLDGPSTARTRIEQHFDAPAVRAWVDSVDAAVAISGPTLASYAQWAGIVDEIQVFVAPAVVGGGLRMIPDSVRLDLELEETAPMGDGFVFLRYATGRA